MQSVSKFIITISLLFALFLPIASAQDTAKSNLPIGAKARLGKGEISDLTYSPDGTKLAVASSIGIWIYNAQTGEEIDLITGHTDWVLSIAFSPDGNTIASGSSDKTIRLWNANTGKHLRTLSGHTSRNYNLAFSPDGNTIASGSYDKTIRLWNKNTSKLLRTLTGHTDFVDSIAFSPDGKYIASGSGDGTILLWEVPQ